MIVVVETAAHNPWGLGWEALVAIATFVLAMFTWRLAARTRDLAKESEADERAQWRPVLLPVNEDSSRFRWGVPNEGLYYSQRLERLAVPIRNSGRGPALHVRVQLERVGTEGAVSPWNWSLGAVGSGEKVELVFDNAAFAERAQLLIDYRDVVGRQHATASTIERRDAVHVYDVRVFEDHSVTTLADAVYPQEGLRDVRPQKGRG